MKIPGMVSSDSCFEEIQNALPLAPPSPSSSSVAIQDVEIQDASGCVKATSCLLFPFLPCGLYCVEAKTATASMNMGVLTHIESEPGLHFAWPCGLDQYTTSTKQRTMEIQSAKVADARGNPINISAIINFYVVDPKKAILNVENLESYVNTNGQAILKQTVSHYTYDQLKTDYNLVNDRMRQQLQPVVFVAGVEISAMCLNDLAYAPRWQRRMLKKQQASALVEARTLIVEGACRIAQDAVTRLEADGTVQLTDDQKVTVVTNLLTVTCSDVDATPTLGLR